jgi:hypothetical protein
MGKEVIEVLHLAAAVEKGVSVVFAEDHGRLADDQSAIIDAKSRALSGADGAKIDHLAATVEKGMRSCVGADEGLSHDLQLEPTQRTERQ